VHVPILLYECVYFVYRLQCLCVPMNGLVLEIRRLKCFL